MNYKTDFGKPACYEAPKVSVFNIVSEGFRRLVLQQQSVGRVAFIYRRP